MNLSTEITWLDRNNLFRKLLILLYILFRFLLLSYYFYEQADAFIIKPFDLYVFKNLMFVLTDWAMPTKEQADV